MQNPSQSFISSLEGVNLSGVKPFLLDLAIECKINLQFVFEEKSLFNHVLDFKVDGDEEDIEYFHNVLDDTLENVQKDNFPQKYYKVASIEMIEKSIDHNQNNQLQLLKTTIVTHRFSQIKKLGFYIAEHFDMNLHISEKKKGFKKEVVFNLNGTKPEITQFKEIFSQFVVNSSQKSKNKLKM